MSRYDEAIEYEQKHLEIAQQIGDISGEGRAYACMGNAHGALGDFQKQLEMNQQYLEISQQTGEN